MSKVAVIIVAAGRGTRAGGDVPKQYQILAGQMVLSRAIAAFDAHPSIGQIIVVHHSDDVNLYEQATSAPARLTPVGVMGGKTRSASVLAGLAAVSTDTKLVLIHDGARPLVSQNVIDRVLASLATNDAAAPAIGVVDALWRGVDGAVQSPQSREGLYRAQTPQGFDIKQLRDAYLKLDGPAADDVEVAIKAGIEVAIVQGDEANLKITTADDFARAEAILRAKNPPDFRVGNGYDVHRFGTGDHVWLCGVKIPHARGLQGHSDADVGMHALTDAIYGALGLGDIGVHFPPSDPQWKGAASHIFLDHAMDAARKRGFEIGNADVTLVCEYPKIGPLQHDMRAVLANIMNTDISRISVKATTSERLGFTGRKEGIASLATVTLRSI